MITASHAVLSVTASWLPLGLEKREAAQGGGEEDSEVRMRPPPLADHRPAVRPSRVTLSTEMHSRCTKELNVLLKIKPWRGGKT